MVREGGFEPPCLAAPAPQAGVSAYFTTRAQKLVVRVKVVILRENGGLCT